MKVCEALGMCLVGTSFIPKGKEVKKASYIV
jgi:hypothetical protein